MLQSASRRLIFTLVSQWARIWRLNSPASCEPRRFLPFEFSNTLGRGDKLSVAALSSGTGLNYGRLDLQVPLNGAGTWAGLGYAQLRYVLGDVFASLNARGTAQVAGGFVQPHSCVPRVLA